MALAFDAKSQGSVDNASSPINVAHVCTGSNRVLFALVGSGTGTTGATYNSIAMTLLATVTNDNYGVLEIYGLLAPATGSNTLSVTWSGTQFIRVIGLSYTGVAQSGLPDAFTTQNFNSNQTTITTSVQTVKTNTWAVTLVRTGATITASTGVTQRDQTVDAFMGGDSNGNITPAQLYGMTATFSSNHVAQIVVSFADVNQPGGLLLSDI